MKAIGLALCAVVLCFCAVSDSYSEADSSTGDMTGIKTIACLPFSGEKRYKEFATSAFWDELNKSGCVELVSIEKARDVVNKEGINLDKISDDDLRKLFKIFECDAIFVCHLKRFEIPLVLGDNFAIVKLFRKDDLKKVFSVEAEGGAITTLTHESCATTAAKNAVKKFIIFVKKSNM